MTGNNDRVQLKQEEVVGNDVVLNDINPKTNTRSVDDPTSGNRLDQTLDRMWKAINNKLSRIVNSVNGRTGVVVLKPEDVGLDQVDNVSLADIKAWVINRMGIEFGYKRLILFENLNELNTYISDNDETHKDKPFYSHHGFDGDKRAYIGYIWWDEGSKKLVETHMVIDTVGYTDNSVIYNETLSDNKDFSGGGLGVNIYTYEDALELYNGRSKADSGLRIKKDKIVPNLYRFDGVYGDGTPEDETAFLYFKTPPTTDNPEISIYIDDVLITKAPIRLNNYTDKEFKFKVGDMIICGFKDYRIWNDEDKYVVPDGMNFGLMYRGAAVGCITTAPNVFEPDLPYIVNFYTIGGHVGYSVTELVGDTYLDNSNNKPRDHFEVKLPIAPYPMEGKSGSHRNCISPIDAIADPSIPSYNNEGSLLRVNFPYGTDEIMFNKDDDNTVGGLIINTDMSLCLQPHDKCSEGWTVGDTTNGSATAENWTGVFGTGKRNPEESLEDGDVINTNTLVERVIGGDSFAGQASYLGINLMKSVQLSNPDEKPSSSGNRFRFTNVSGLRINHSGYALNAGFLGMNEDESTGTGSGPEYGVGTSGGLSVNVGNFLEIKPGDIPEKSEQFYDGGKINVRLGDGLNDDGNNKITINSGKGLIIDDDKKLSINYGKGLIIDPDKKLSINLTHSVVGDYYTEGLSFTEDPNGGYILALTVPGTGGIHGANNKVPSINQASISIYGTEPQSADIDEWKGMVVVHKKRLISFVDNKTNVSYAYDPLDGAITELEGSPLIINIGNGLRLVKNSDGTHTLELDT